MGRPSSLGHYYNSNDFDFSKAGGLALPVTLPAGFAAETSVTAFALVVKDLNRYAVLYSMI